MNKAALVGGVGAAFFMFLVTKFVPTMIAPRMPAIDPLYGNLAIVAILIGGGFVFDHYYGGNFPEDQHD